MPYTRAGCNVGGVATANMELENTSVDIPKVFGVGSPEDEQLINDPDSFKDPETADYVGLVHPLRQGSAVCADAEAHEVRPDTPRAIQPSPTCCRTSRAVTTATRPSSVPSTSTRSWEPGSPT